MARPLKKIIKRIKSYIRAKWPEKIVFDKGVDINSSMTEQLRLVGQQAKFVFEVGAANGSDVVGYSKSLPEATVFAFEPLPASFNKLRKRAENNPRIVATNAAVSDRAGTAKFYVTALDDASSLFVPNVNNSVFDKYMTEVGQIDVAVVTLDAFAQLHKVSKIDLLKMDAQGAELRILHGSSKLLDGQSVSVIYTEVCFMDLYAGGCLYHEIADYLYSKGYVLHSLYNLVHDQQGRLSWGDAIFVPRSTRQ